MSISGSQPLDFPELERLFVIGTSYKSNGFVDLSGWTIPVAFRGFAMQELLDKYDVAEACYLSTCNRSELILWTKPGFSARRVTRRWREWAARGGQPLSDAADLNVRQGQEAGEYLFQVAASLDSLVVGETEILRQLREALRYSKSQDFSGAILRRVFDRALKTGKLVRQKTSLASLSTSVVSVAIKEIRRREAHRNNLRALVIGAGETGQAVTKALKSIGATTIAIANRTLARAQHLADKVNGAAFPLQEVPHLIRDADIVVSAAAVPFALIHPEMLEGIEHKILLVDLAIPANINPACRELPNVDLIDLPTLEQTAAKNKPLLEREAEYASNFVAEGLRKLQDDFRAAALSSDIRKSREEFLAQGHSEIAALLNNELSQLPESERQAVENRLEKMLQRLCYTATTGLKRNVRRHTFSHDKQPRG